MRCDQCSGWETGERFVYGDGTVIEPRVGDSSQCLILKIKTAADFGCNKFEEGRADQTVYRDGSPWMYFDIITCPDCSGEGYKCGAHGRCNGTGKVRLYGDGYLGDEQTREHPKEKEARLALAAAKKRAALEAELAALSAGQAPPPPVVEVDGTVLAPQPRANIVPEGASVP